MFIPNPKHVLIGNRVKINLSIQSSKHGGTFTKGHEFLVADISTVEGSNGSFSTFRLTDDDGRTINGILRESFEIVHETAENDFNVTQPAQTSRNLEFSGYCLPAVTSSLRHIESHIDRSELANGSAYSACNAHQETMLGLYAEQNVIALEQQLLLDNSISTSIRFDGFSIIADTHFEGKVKWAHAGTALTINTVTLNNIEGVLFSNNAFEYRNNIFSIQTLSGDTVWLYDLSKEIRNGDIDNFETDADVLKTFEFAHKCSVEHNNNPKSFEYTELAFPKVIIRDAEVDMSSLLGLGYGGFHVSKASQLLSLRLDEYGAEVEADVHITMTKGICLKNRYTIDGPFLIWMTKPDSTIPYFVAIITPDHFVKAE